MPIPPISSQLSNQLNRLTSHALVENIEPYPQLRTAPISKPEPAISFPLVLMLLFVTSSYLTIFISSLFLVSRREELPTHEQATEAQPPQDLIQAVNQTTASPAVTTTTDATNHLLHPKPNRPQKPSGN
ncbi:hypothetical protein ACKFKF_05735 [Phormidesmis sp. 146-12]